MGCVRKRCKDRVDSGFEKPNNTGRTGTQGEKRTRKEQEKNKKERTRERERKKERKKEQERLHFRTN